MACRRLDPATAAAPPPTRPRHLATALPGVLGVSPGWPDNNPVHPAVEIAIYPDVIRLAAQTLHAPDTSHPAGR
jgi:hypothetical protein